MAAGLVVVACLSLAQTAQAASHPRATGGGWTPTTKPEDGTTTTKPKEPTTTTRPVTTTTAPVTTTTAPVTTTTAPATTTTAPGSTTTAPATTTTAPGTTTTTEGVTTTTAPGVTTTKPDGDVESATTIASQVESNTTVKVTPTVESSELARTGVSTGKISFLALLALAAGAVSVTAARRRRGEA